MNLLASENLANLDIDDYLRQAEVRDEKDANAEPAATDAADTATSDTI